MLLAIDIGNSNVVVGVNKEDKWLHIWRIPTLHEQHVLMYYEQRMTDFFLEAGIPISAIRSVVISSVVPTLNRPFEELTTHLFGQAPILVAPSIYPKLDLQIDRPNELGTDLLANAVAAHKLYGQDVIIVDFGTALTFTTVTKAGHLLGVAIAPGLKTAISSLFNKTAQLPEVPLFLPTSPIGKNTVHAIQSGILLGYIGLVRYMIQAIRAEVGEQYIAIATGGLSLILTPLEDDFYAINPDLTLTGLKIIAETVKGNS
jgi:type III pantothenate kinase